MRFAHAAPAMAAVLTLAEVHRPIVMTELAGTGRTLDSSIGKRGIQVSRPEEGSGDTRPVVYLIPGDSPVFDGIGMPGGSGSRVRAGTTLGRSGQRSGGRSVSGLGGNTVNLGGTLVDVGGSGSGFRTGRSRHSDRPPTVPKTRSRASGLGGTPVNPEASGSGVRKGRSRHSSASKGKTVKDSGSGLGGTPVNLEASGSRVRTGGSGIVSASKGRSKSKMAMKDVVSGSPPDLDVTVPNAGSGRSGRSGDSAGKSSGSKGKHTFRDDTSGSDNVHETQSEVDRHLARLGRSGHQSHGLLDHMWNP